MGYFPPYGADRNSIEKAFSKLKAYLCKIAGRSLVALTLAIETCAQRAKLIRRHADCSTLIEVRSNANNTYCLHCASALAVINSPALRFRNVN